MIRSCVTLTRLHMDKPYHVIHFHNIPDFGVFSTVFVKMMGAKIILDIHDLVPEFYMRKFNVSKNHPVIIALKLIENFSARYADHVITVTELWKDRLVSRSVSPLKCTVILNTPDPKIFKKIEKIGPFRNAHFSMCYHGNLNEPTGVDIAIRAVADVRGDIPGIHFIIIGKGRDRELLENMTRELDIEKHVQFLDPVPIAQIPEITGRADIGVDPKRDGVYAGETLSVKAMEYLAMGMPLLVSRTEVARQYFDEGMVMFFEPDNAADMARGIRELYQSPCKRQSLSIRALQFSKRFHWSHYQNQYYHVLDNLMNE
jgi:glycosyltransferase involved in cell wall biosynthesis